ncbi:hypothetical protein DFH06DRAFT_1479006 [Mycena polygramma]|nr:hypothetical protein DFH06DRAFT_1479006 [Mycena polygramma]
MSHSIDPTTFEKGWDYATSETIGLCVGTLFYGILLVLLGMAAYLLYHWTGSGRKILAAATVAMGALATAQIALQLRGTFLRLHLLCPHIPRYIFRRGGSFGYEQSRRRQPLCQFSFFQPIITDLLLLSWIYRCFVIWGHSVGAVAVPTLMLFTTAALGYSADYGDIVSSAFYIDVRVPLATGLATNVVLLGLTGYLPSLPNQPNIHLHRCSG